jgi:hypothetical protein
LFITAAGTAMARGLDIQCGCFTLSSAHDKVGWSLIVRDAFLLALCLLLLFVYGDMPEKPYPKQSAPETKTPSGCAS